MKMHWIFLPFLLCIACAGNTQILKKVKEAAKRGAEETTQRKVEEKSAQKTDEAMDVILGNKKLPSKKKTDSKDKEVEVNQNAGNDNGGGGENNNSPSDGSGPNIQGKVLFTDDFESTPVGDFPPNFTSSAGGSIVETSSGKGLLFYPNSNVLLQTPSLPADYSLEFDLIVNNVPPSLYNTFFNIYFQELKVLKYNDPKNKFGAVGFSLWGNKKDQNIDIFNKKAAFEIAEKIPFDVPGEILDKTSKFSILVNGHRLQLYVNGKKVADSPNLLEGLTPAYINFRLNGTKKEEKHQFIIRNVKVTAIEKDLRAQLINEGRFSTSNILFASGSDKIQAGSYALLDEIAAVMNDNSSSFLITGHTDSDGDESSNLALSRKRAESVKNYLVGKGIAADRLQTDGKGEKEPVSDNASAEGKSQNRRVEFKKL